MSLQLMDAVLIDNKVGENYFGKLPIQLRHNGRTLFKAIGERLLLSSNADLAFSEDSKQILA